MILQYQLKFRKISQPYGINTVSRELCLKIRSFGERIFGENSERDETFQKCEKI